MSGATFKFIFLVLSACTVSALPATGRRLGEGGGNTIGSQNHKRSNSPQKVIRSYTPACAKPLVICWHFRCAVEFAVIYWFIIHRFYFSIFKFLFSTNERICVIATLLSCTSRSLCGSPCLISKALMLSIFERTTNCSNVA